MEAPTSLAYVVDFLIDYSQYSMQLHDWSVNCDGRKYDHISPLPHDLHWLQVPQRIKFRLAVLVYHCQTEYLSRDLQWAADSDSRKRLRSSSTHKLMVPRTRLKTSGDRTFGAAAARVWNELPPTVVNASSLLAFKTHLKHICLTLSRF